jgi:hypothetical protein
MPAINGYRKAGAAPMESFTLTVDLARPCSTMALLEDLAHLDAHPVWDGRHMTGIEATVRASNESEARTYLTSRIDKALSC